jgi:hypothetical protein
MADPRRMTPQEHGEAHALLVRAVTDPDWHAASQALAALDRAAVTVWSRPRPRRRPRRSRGSWPAALDLSRFVGAPRAGSPIAGWAFGTHPRLTGCAGSATLAMFANGAAAGTAGRTTGDQEGHRVAAAAPPGCEWTVSVALHSWAFLLRAALGYEGPERNHRPLAPGSRSGVSACASVTPTPSLAFLQRSVVGCGAPRSADANAPGRRAPPRPGRLRTRP